MKCQKCGANNANTHVKTVINGEIKEYDLCSECAKKMGYTNIFGNFEDEFSGLLGSFFGNSLPARTQATRCDFCGSSYSDIAKSGHVGCAKCYEIFGDQLLPSIRRIHGNTTVSICMVTLSLVITGCPALYKRIHQNIPQNFQ